MQINTNIKEIIVTVDGADYPVAEKTIEIAERMKEAAESHAGKSLQYELWLDQIGIMLGAEAVKKLFPKGKGENLDRMENIYYGVLSAFDHNGQDIRESRCADALAQVDKMAEKIKPFREMMEKYPVVKKVE